MFTLSNRESRYSDLDQFGGKYTKQTYKNKFNSEKCNDTMTFQDCELAILRQAVDENDIQKKKKIANSKEVQQMITIVEEFLKKSKCICYGGTAINNILPKESQFYNRDIETPDYDFYSATPLEHAKELADIFFKAGYADVDAKSGAHPGTFKVFVNFIPMADITELHSTLFHNILQDSVKINGILYCPVNFLRMNMFIELSRPEGDVSRWEKVMKRLNLLNKHYPLKSSRCKSATFQRDITITKSLTKHLSNTIHKTLFESFVDQGCVFFGGYATSLYNNYTTLKEKQTVALVPEFEVLAENVDLISSIIQESLESEKIKNITIEKHDAIGEVIPKYNEIKVGKTSVAYIYEPIACHSYNELNIDGKNIRIATIDTMLNFYLSFLYGNEEASAGYKNRLLCMSRFLFDIEQKHRLEQKGLLKRFSMTCYGKQPTLESIRSEKAAKYQQLKQNKDSYEYKRLFFKYHPTKQSATMSVIPKKKNVLPTTYKKPKKHPAPKKNTTKKKKKFVLNIPVNNQKFLF